MAPEIQAVVHATQAWLQSSWHIRVPFAWLDACVEWLQEEAGGAGRLSQQQINQQALDQWLLTDLRDLDHPVLPEGLSQAQKTELSGTFCVQVDSLLDVSQPAYSQLQKLRGTDCANDEVSAVTQTSQRPWEARPTRMLLLQVTDGVQSLEAMEYQPIPALSTALRPGVKLQLRGQMVCRLGVLLLGPSNIKVLGGEVEDLVDRNNQGRVLCRTLGVPEEQQQQEGAPQENQEVEDPELDDAELLASLDAQEDAVRAQVRPIRDSGYGTLSETSSQSSRSSSVRSLVSTASSRSEVSARSYRSGLIQSNRSGSVQGHHRGDLIIHSLSDDSIQQETPNHHMADEDFPDEDFDNLPLDELDSVVFQESANVAAQPDDIRRQTPQSDNRTTGHPSRATEPPTSQFERHSLSCLSSSRSSTQKRDYQGCIRGASGQIFSSPDSKPSQDLDESDFMDEDMDCILREVETGAVQTSTRTESSSSSCRLPSDSSRSETPQRQSCMSGTSKCDRLPAVKGQGSESSAPALTLTSPPFTYLRLIEERTPKPDDCAIEIRVKAFIVTLLGKLSSNSGVWSVCATISDGTGYLDVELSDGVLTGLLGFSVAEKGVLKRDPVRRGELDAGMRRCQEALVDMCCVMTIVVEPGGGKAVVTKADPVSEKVLQELEQRVRDGKK